MLTPFAQFATRAQLARMLLAVVNHPVNKAGRDEMRKPAHLRVFLPAVASNLLTSWHFFRDNGLEGVLARLRATGCEGISRDTQVRADKDARTWKYDLQRRRAKRGARAEQGVSSGDTP